MKNAILVHGCCDKEEFFSDKYPSLSNSHWFPWLQKQLTKTGLETQTPEMPKPYSPNYSNWKKLFEGNTINASTVLVGHSCGAGFLVRWLSENSVKVGKVALVAPWMDPERTIANNFFEFAIDPDLLNRIKSLKVFYSSDDDADILTTVKLLQAKLPKAQFEKFADRGHFTLGDMKTDQFPELRDYLLG